MDISGNTVEEVTKRTLKFLLGHQLSRCYNLSGQCGKLFWGTIALQCSCGMFFLFICSKGYKIDLIV